MPKQKCSFEKKLCEAFGLKMCPRCNIVLKGVCGKVNCRKENGQKLCMILAACSLQTSKALEVYYSSDDDSLNHSSNSSVASDMLISY